MLLLLLFALVSRVSIHGSPLRPDPLLHAEHASPDLGIRRPTSAVEIQQESLGGQYCGWTTSISHHLETMQNHCLLVFAGESLQGFLGGAGFRPSTVSFSPQEHVGNLGFSTYICGNVGLSPQCHRLAEPTCPHNFMKREIAAPISKRSSPVSLKAESKRPTLAIFTRRRSPSLGTGTRNQASLTGTQISSTILSTDHIYPSGCPRTERVGAYPHRPRGQLQAWRRDLSTAPTKAKIGSN